MENPLRIHSRVRAIGVDVGRVLIHPGVPGSADDTSFLRGSDDDAMRTPPYDGAIEALTTLFDWFEGRAYIVSKAGPRVADRTRRWFVHHDVHSRTGVRPEQMFFCKERSDKRLHAVNLELTHFVDDRPDVLTHLEGVVPHRFLFGPQKPGRFAPPDFVAALTWREALDAIARTLDEPDEGLARAAGTRAARRP